MSVKTISDNIDFLLFEKGENVLINDIPIRALVIKSQASSGYYITDKTIYCKTVFQTGSVVDFNSKKWLLISQVEKEEAVFKGVLRECNYLLKLGIDEWAYPFNAVIEMGQMGFKGGSGFQIADGKLYATVQSNELTEKVGINHRFIASDSAWKVVGVDKTLPGLITLFAEKDLIQQGDDIENEIPNSVPKWTMEITNIPESLGKGDSMLLDVALKKNGTLYEGQQFIYCSSSEQVASFNDNILTGVAEGDAEITVKWAKHPELASSFNLVVKNSAPVVITYKMFMSNLDGSNETETFAKILQGTTKRFVIKKYENGIMATQNDTYAFEFNPNGATSANYAFAVIDDFSCSINNKSRYTGGAVYITGTSNQAGVSIEKTLMLGGVF